MTNSVIGEIFEKYASGEYGVDEVNAKLIEAGSVIRLIPDKNLITPEEVKETVVSVTPSKVNGYGLLHTGTGTMDKVHIVNGTLDHHINELTEDGTVNMRASVHVLDRVYEVRVDTLV